MKCLFDLLPVVLFLVAVELGQASEELTSGLSSHGLGGLAPDGGPGPTEAPVLLALLTVILVALVQVAWLKATRRKVELTFWLGLALVAVLGGQDLWLDNATLNRWKPSVLYWAIGTALWLSPLVFGRNLLKSLLGPQLTLPAKTWHRLNFAWVALFAGMGLINLWIAHALTVDAWGAIKLRVNVGLIVGFVVAQALVLDRHARQAPALDRSTESR